MYHHASYKKHAYTSKEALVSSNIYVYIYIYAYIHGSNVQTKVNIAKSCPSSFSSSITYWQQIDGLMQDCSKSSALAMELLHQAIEILLL